VLRLQNYSLGPFGGKNSGAVIIGFRAAYSDRIPSQCGASKFAGIGGLAPIVCEVVDVNDLFDGAGNFSDDESDYDSDDTPPEFRNNIDNFGISNKDIILPVETLPYVIDNSRAKKMEELEDKLRNNKNLLRVGDMLEQSRKNAEIANQLFLQEEYDRREKERVMRSERRMSFGAWRGREGSTDSEESGSEFMLLNATMTRPSVSENNRVFTDDSSFDDLKTSGRELLRYGLGL